MRKLYSVLLSFIFISSSFAQIPSVGLLGEWTFTNGQLLDAFNTYPAVAQPGAVTTSDRFGNTNCAYDLPPAAFLTFGDVFDGNTNGTNNFSFSYWVKFDQINNTYRYMLGKAGFPTLCGADARQFAFLIDGSNRVEAILFGALTGGHIRYASSGTISANQWIHIAFVVNVSQLISSNLAGMKIYINGALQTTTITETSGGGLSGNGMDNGTAEMSAARYAGPGGVQCGTTQYMDGQFDDLRVYNRQLTQQEVTQLYEHVPCAQTAITQQLPSAVAFCSGSSAQLSIGLSDPNATSGWQVFTGGNWAYLGVQTGEVTAAGNYRVEIVSPCGAYGYSDVCTVTVDAPAFTETPATNPQNAYICPGETGVVLEANGTGEGITYQWREQIGGIWNNISGEDQATYTATALGTYDVVLFACGMSATSVPFNVANSPTTPSISVTVYDPSSTICAGQSVRLFSISGGGGGSIVVWEPGGVVDANPTFYPTETTTYTGTVTTPYGCTASTTATVTVYGFQPTITNNAGTLEVSGGPYTNISWFLAGSPISGANSSTYTPVEDGSYTVWINENGCPNTSDPYAYTGVPTGIDGVVASGLKVYPNPFNTEFVIETTELTTISIMNAMGEVVLTRTINGRTSIDATTLSAGIYFVREETSGAVMKLVKN
jgi:hypothetical protein